VDSEAALPDDAVDLDDPDFRAVVDLQRGSREESAVVGSKSYGLKRGRYAESKGQLMKTLFS